MKKIVLLTMVLMMVFTGSGWCLNGTVDNAINKVSGSDIGPVADSGRILDATNKGIDKGYHAVTDPMAPVLNPVRKVRDESVKGTKTVINFIWDAVTLKSLREKK